MARNKPRLFLILRHRNSLSLPPNRARLNRESYHWSLMIAPKKTPHFGTEYDATDALVLDPVTKGYVNENCEWVFRKRDNMDVSLDGRVIGRVEAGKLAVKDYEGIGKILEAVPLPLKDQMPNQSCVTWTLGAVKALQDAGWVRQFDVEKFADWVLEKGDCWMRDLTPGGGVCQYKG